MRRILIAGLTLLGVLLLSGSQVQAQVAYKHSVGWAAGVVSTSSLNDGSGGALSLEPDLTWTAGAYFDYWLGGHVGLRGQGGVTRHTLPWTQGDREIYSYSVDLSFLLRPAGPVPGRSLLPFVSGGVGVARWGLGRGAPTTFGAAAATYDGSESYNLLVPVSVGVDYITPWNWGEGPMVIRIEGREHLQLMSPFDPVNPDQDDFGMVHNYGVLIGVHTGLGVLGGGS
jgi:hypothetical protein